MTEALHTLHGEIIVPYAFMLHRQPADVERELQDSHILPVLAYDKRWRMVPEHGGYMLSYTCPAPVEEP